MRKLPAWMVQTGESSHPEWVYIFKDEIDSVGWPKIKMVNYLTPVDPEEQARLAKIRPSWM